MAETMNFDNDKPGSLPPAWSAGVTGRGAPKWAVEQDATAPSRPNVLKQSGSVEWIESFDSDSYFLLMLEGTTLVPKLLPDSWGKRPVIYVVYFTYFVIGIIS